MPKLHILKYPNPRLRIKAKKVNKFDKSLENLVNDLFETMYFADGIGLAATQVDIHKQVVVMDLSEKKNSPKVFVNPQFTVKDDKSLYSCTEGCLSIPGFHEEILRPDKIIVNYQDIHGKLITEEPEGLLTVCYQHEVDHLNGILFVDYLSPLKRSRIKKKLESEKK